jgi:hypothetical protein
VPDVESIAFTIWWGDTPRSNCPEKPPESDIRVRVQADIYPDFATVTFIIDGSKRWHAEPYPAASDPARVEGVRRKQIFATVKAIRDACEPRVNDQIVRAGDVLPERNIDATAAEALFTASDTLYRKIWEDFGREFGISLDRIAGDTDKAFANFRGVVLSAPAEPHGIEPPAGTFERFARHDDPNHVYPSTVVKAYWPFVRRSRSEADHRDWIACGVFGWRALYITALGGQSDFFAGDEAEISTAGVFAEHTPAELAELDKRGIDISHTDGVEAGFLPKRAILSESEMPERLRDELDQIAKTATTEQREEIEALKGKLRDWPVTVEGDRPAPYRYLFLVAGEPHRKQVGRMVDRVNWLGTMRLYAMKNWTIIRDADVHVRMYGQLLDFIMRDTTREASEKTRTWWGPELERAIAELDKLRGLPLVRSFLADQPGLRTRFDVARQRMQDEVAAVAAAPLNDRSVDDGLLAEYRWLLEDGARRAAEAKLALAAVPSAGPSGDAGRKATEARLDQVADQFKAAHNIARQSKARRDEGS